MLDDSIANVLYLLLGISVVCSWKELNSLDEAAELLAPWPGLVHLPPGSVCIWNPVMCTSVVRQWFACRPSGPDVVEEQHPLVPLDC